MSDGFDARKDCPALRRATGAYIASLLEDALPPLRLAARGCGYALALHGSLQRDIDIVAVPWVANAQSPELLVERLCGVIAGLTGRALKSSDWTDKAHGRRATTIMLASSDTYFDLSIMPLIETKEAT